MQSSQAYTMGESSSLRPGFPLGRLRGSVAEEVRYVGPYRTVLGCSAGYGACICYAGVKGATEKGKSNRNERGRSENW